MAYDNCGSGWVLLWVVMRVGGFPSCHVVGCSYGGGVGVKISFDKRPKIWVQSVVAPCPM